MSGTRGIVENYLDRLGKGDPAAIADLFGPRIDWRLSWPDSEIGGDVPWIRFRSTPEDIRRHYEQVAEHNVPAARPTTVERILVDGPHAVLLGTIRNRMKGTGVPYESHFALHLTMEGGKIVRHHVYEDSLSIARAWDPSMAHRPT